MIKIIIYQDFLQSTNKEQFILDSINQFKASDFYNNALESQAYYLGQNTTINQRKFTFYNKGGQIYDDIFRSNNKIASGFYAKIVKQLNSYVLANGVTISENNIKKDLGRWFDVKLQELGTYAQVDGVGYGYGYLNANGKFQMEVWRGTETIPMFDEKTGVIMGIIRFWQIAPERPLNVELYTIEGKTELTENEYGELKITKPTTSYKLNMSNFGGEISYSEAGSFSVLPIFPLYSKDTKVNMLDNSLKSKIDLFDIINSDFGNNLEDSNDVYWVLKNYAGQDIGDFLEQYKQYKTIAVDDEGSAEMKTTEVPYQARQTALEMLRHQIYDDSMALDTSILSGGSLTNVAIKANMMNLDLKADEFENQVYSFLYNMIDLYLEIVNSSDTEYEIELIRRSIVNDTEIIDNIIKIRSDISHKTALKLNPYIKDEEEELRLIDEEGLSRYDRGFEETKIIEENE